MSTQEPTIADLARAIVATSIGQVRTSLPAVILAYDRATQRARIRITVRTPFRDPATGQITEWVQPPPISNVPVQWSGGAAGSLTIDLAAGDAGIVLIGERDLSGRKTTGTGDNTPTDSRRMDLSDALFVPGITPDTAPLPGGAVADGAMVLYGDEVRLGD